MPYPSHTALAASPIADQCSCSDRIHLRDGLVIMEERGRGKEGKRGGEGRKEIKLTIKMNAYLTPIKYNHSACPLHLSSLSITFFFSLASHFLPLYNNERILCAMVD